MKWKADGIKMEVSKAKNGLRGGEMILNLLPGFRPKAQGPDNKNWVGCTRKAK